MMYKVTHDLVAIPASDDLVQMSEHHHKYTFWHTDRSRLSKTITGSHFPRTIILWNTLSANIPTLPTLVQSSSAVCQEIHVSPKYQPLVLSFIYTCTCTSTAFRTVQNHLTTFPITLYQLTASALGIPEYPSDVPYGS